MQTVLGHERELVRLRNELDKWQLASQQGHSNPCDLGTLCPYCEIERLKELHDDGLVDCGGCTSTPVRGQPHCPGHDIGEMIETRSRLESEIKRLREELILSRATRNPTAELVQEQTKRINSLEARLAKSVELSEEDRQYLAEAFERYFSIEDGREELLEWRDDLVTKLKDYP